MKLKTTEKGFTLIELLVALAIAAFVTAAASMTIITMMRLSPKTNDWTYTLRQVQNTGYWISQDITMAKGNPPITINGQFLPSLYLDVWNNTTKAFEQKHVEYVFNGQTLRRKLDDASPGLLIAENMDTVATKFEDITPYPPPPGQHKEYKLTVKATVNGTSVTRTYQISRRLP
jgi:prepilin-type N-terminal cleavage/methylation domain-containing protein